MSSELLPLLLPGMNDKALLLVQSALILAVCLKSVVTKAVAGKCVFGCAEGMLAEGGTDHDTCVCV